MRERKETAVFYVGGRKFEIAITCEVKAIFEIIEEIQAYENTEYMISMIKRWKQGSSDKSIMNDKPISRNAYYDRKEKFINKIFILPLTKNMRIHNLYIRKPYGYNLRYC